MTDSEEWSVEDAVRALAERLAPSRHDVTAGPIWVHVRPRTASVLPEQGWKLHISSRSSTLPGLVERLVPRLLTEGCRFKIALNATVLGRLNNGRDHPAAVGKAVTIYPDPTRVAGLGWELADLLRGHAGPRVLSDRRVAPDAPVYYRYGPFSARWHADPGGMLAVRLDGPDGEYFEAAATLEYRQPAWVEDPFRTAGSAVAPATTDDGDVLLGGRYRVLVGVFGAAHGNVYRAVDTAEAASDGRTVIVKQARAYVGEHNESGADVRTRLRNERRVLAGCDGIEGVPRFLDHFAHAGDEYLVTTDVGTENLLARVHGSGGLLPPHGPADEMVGLAAQLATILARLHDRGVVMRDLSPRNIVLDGDAVRIVDFGISALDGFHLPGGTPGFAPPEQLVGAAAPAPELDAYALGMVLAYAATGLLPVSGARTTELARARATQSLAAIYGADRPGFTAIVAALLSRDPDRTADALDTLRAGSWIDVRAASGPVGGRAESGPVGVLPAAADPAPAAHLEQAVLDALLDGVGNQQLAGEAGDFAAVDASLYTGTAGIGLELLHHRDRSGVPELLERLAVHTRTAVRRVDLPAGLFSGLAGPALFLGAMDGGADAPSVPREVGQDELYDVATGIAGTGLGLIRAGDLDAARQLAGSLLERDEVREMALGPGEPVADNAGFGYAHGFVGVTDFLVVLAARTGDAALLGAAHTRVVALVRRVPELTAADFVAGSSALVPPALAAGPMTASWCRGLTGLARLLIHAWEAFDEAEFARAAQSVALAAAAWLPRLDNLSQCCGATGIGTMLVEAARVFGAERYLTEARAVVRHLMRRNHGPDDRPVLINAGLQQTPYAWAQGYAGLLTFLRRVQRPDSPDPFLPAVRADVT